MLGHASAAMTLDAYADLFESDLDEVAVTVAKMWPREPETNTRSAPKTPDQAISCAAQGVARYTADMPRSTASTM